MFPITLQFQGNSFGHWTISKTAWKPLQMIYSVNLHFVKCVDSLPLCSSKELEKSSCPPTSTFLSSELVTAVFHSMDGDTEVQPLTSLFLNCCSMTSPFEYSGNVCDTIAFFLSVLSCWEKRSKMCPKAHCRWEGYGLSLCIWTAPFPSAPGVTLSDLDGWLFVFSLGRWGIQKELQGTPKNIYKIYGEQVQGMIISGHVGRSVSGHRFLNS